MAVDGTPSHSLQGGERKGRGEGREESVHYVNNTPPKLTCLI